MMQNRPLVMTIWAKKIETIEDAWINSIAEELTAKQLSQRAKNPYRTVPVPFNHARQNPLKLVDDLNLEISEHALVIAATVMLDAKFLLQTRSLNKGCHDGLNMDRRKIGWRILRYVLRHCYSHIHISPPHSGILPALSSSVINFGIDLDQIIPDLSKVPSFVLHPFLDNNSSPCTSFIQLMDVLTPAAFAYSPETTRQLKIEGFPIELAFVRIVLRISLRHNEHLYQVFLLEGIDSVFFVRIFLVLLTQLSSRSEVDWLQKALNGLTLEAVTEEVIRESHDVQLTSQWIRNWRDREYGN